MAEKWPPLRAPRRSRAMGQLGPDIIAPALSVPRRGVIFADAEKAAAFIAEASATDVVVIVPAFPCHARGHLFDRIEDACDGALAKEDAPPAGMGAFGTLEDRLRDRLFR